MVHGQEITEHALEMLTRAVTARSGSYDGAGAKKMAAKDDHDHLTGKQTRVTRPDRLIAAIGYALGGMEEAEAAVLMLKYGGGGGSDWLTCIRSTYQAIHEEHNRRKLRRLKWTDVPTSTLGAIAVTAVTEYAQTRVCRRCKGRAEVWVEDKRIECGACNGAGAKAWTADERARGIGVGRTSYYGLLWLYAAALAHLRILEGEATYQLRKRLGLTGRY